MLDHMLATESENLKIEHPQENTSSPEMAVSHTPLRRNEDECALLILPDVL